MGKFKLKKSEYFKFINESTYIGNINSGQVLPPNMYNLKQKMQPIANSQKIDYNNSNFIADNTTPQSNYMNIRGIKK